MIILRVLVVPFKLFVVNFKHSKRKTFDASTRSLLEVTRKILRRKTTTNHYPQCKNHKIGILTSFIHLLYKCEVSIPFLRKHLANIFRKKKELCSVEMDFLILLGIKFKVYYRKGNVENFSSGKSST